MIKANYHTHTTRCQHAVGTEREYIEAAISAGYTTLGFSDHVPMPYPEGIRSRIRMGMEELPDYISTLLKLREEYADRIRILIGFEVEYFPEYHKALMKALSAYPIDYLILGQHYVPDEFEGFYSGSATDDEEHLKSYVDLTIQGMETGLFSYLAHPDLIHYKGPKEIYRKHMERICRASNDLGIPLEVNILGFYTGRHYPCDMFYKLAVECGCRFILGIDAHNPDMMKQPEDYPGLMEFIHSNGITYTDELELKCFS